MQLGSTVSVFIKTSYISFNFEKQNTKKFSAHGNVCKV